MEETLPIILTKTQVRKLGDKLREGLQLNNFSQDSLLKLQEVRISHKQSLSDIFQILSEESKKVRKSRVVTYRIKRIESIISKLRRYPTMELDRIVDIAGCRCIVDSISEIYSIKESIKNKVNIFGERDYIKNKAPDGYTALHLFVKSKSENNKPIEIQLRTRHQHNWATFVEIIDVLFNTKIKEGEKHPDLERFCYLLSLVGELSFEHKIELLQIEKKYLVYSKMGEVFSSNYILTRKKWLSIEEKKEHKFFIIEVDEEKKTHIEPFEDFEIAEQKYFEKFNNDKTNIVLTHIEKPSYKLISLAYSNYILSMHKFQEDLCNIAKETTEYYVEKKENKKAEEISVQYRKYIDQEASNFTEEMSELKKSVPANDPNNSKVDEWFIDMTDRFAQRGKIFIESEQQQIRWQDVLILFIRQALKKLFK